MERMTFKRIIRRAAMMVVMLTAPAMTAWGQDAHKKYSMTTRMFMDELQEQKEQQAGGMHRTPARRQSEGRELPEPQRMIASPDTIDGVAYISCFIHLDDPSNLSDVRDLGVQVQGTFDGLNFVTANVPVEQLEALADVNNVTNIEVASLMSTMSDVARQKTNVNDLLNVSANAATLGINSQYDGTGVVLGIVDTGIDFQHIAFKDKAGNSRIKRAYIYNGSKSGVIYKDEALLTLTTDNTAGDHGTHVASTAGGSSVVVNKIADDNFTIEVTDDHANATYGGMAPGADLYLAGLKSLKDTELTNAIQKVVEYADSVGKPVVVSNSWGSQVGPHDGTGTMHTFLDNFFGDSHPNHIILFASSNDAGRGTGSDGGGFFVKKSAASQTSPLGTIIRTRGEGGNAYSGWMASAWAASDMNCKLYVLSNTTGEVLKSWTVTETTSMFDGLSTYYTGSMTIEVDKENGKPYVGIKSPKDLKTTNENAYTLAIEIYPENAETSADINMWASNGCYFTSHLTTDDHEWINGTDDMCVSDQSTNSNVISVGAYMTKHGWDDYKGKYHYYTSLNTEGDIANFSSYATAEMSPTGQAYPWITAPGAAVVAGVNHLHTTEVDDKSYLGGDNVSRLIVNNTTYPYGVMQGTSMATPVAAGIVALWLQAAKEHNKTLTVNQVKELMRLSAINDEYTTTGDNASHFGHGKIDALAGLYAITGGLSLADNAINSKKIAAAAETGESYNVTLAGRTLYKDGAWNTLCLPFDVTIDSSPLAGATVKKLTSSTSSLADGILTLNFEDETTTMTAGTPYLIKWASGDDLTSPTFNGVTVSNASTAVASTDGTVTFQGTYDPIVWESANTSILFLGVNKQNKSTLYYPKPSGDQNPSVKACRAYFELGDGSQPARSFVLDFGEENTGIEGIEDGKLKMENGDKDLQDRTKSSIFNPQSSILHDLQGRRVSRPVKGLYIHNGRKVMVK